MADMRRKNGEEFVEASIVLPLLILVIASMLVMVRVFVYGIYSQSDMHAKLVDESISSSKIFGTIDRETEKSADTLVNGGITITSKAASRIYALDQDEAVRLGELG